MQNVLKKFNFMSVLLNKNSRYFFPKKDFSTKAFFSLAVTIELSNCWIIKLIQTKHNINKAQISRT